MMSYKTSALDLAQVGTNLALDIVILGFPSPMIFNLQMPVNRKIAVALILGLGLVSV